MFFIKSHKIIICFFLICCFSNGRAQDTINAETLDQKSYRLYLDKNWTELIKCGKKALTKGYDYFYMRMRLGIAYYEKKNYSLAESHFRKALKFNSGDELAQEYLYYCYFFNGRYDESRKLSKNFSKELSQKIGTDKLKPVGFVLVEGGTKISDSASYYSNISKKNSNYFDPATYFQIGLGHFIKNRVSLFHAFTYFNQKSFLGTTRQIQYYLKASIPLKHNFLLSPSFHYVGINHSIETVTMVTPMQPPPPPGLPLRTYTTLSTSSSQANYFVASLALQKFINKITLSLGSTVSNMSNVTQFIHSGFISYSVLGNSKLVLGCSGYLHTVNNYSTINNSVVPFIYVQPVNRISIKASYLMNNGNNIIEDNGYLVNNSPDLTKSRWSLLTNVVINKHLSVYGLYQFENKKESVQSFNYHYNVIVGGIKITP